MPDFIDQTGRIVSIPKNPTRIISVVPSQTELLFDLGLDESVIGITKFCVHPEQWFRDKTRIGGTKQLHVEQILSLQPDLVIANKEENVREQIEELSKKVPVWISDVTDLTSALEMIRQVSLVTGKKEKGESIINKIQTAHSQFSILPEKIRSCYLIWKDPYMTIGHDTFIHSMMELAGFENIYSDHTRYPEIELNTLSSQNCELLLLPSEPYPFREKHKMELQNLLPGIKIKLADGEMFSWYGSRLIKAFSYLEKLRYEIINPTSEMRGPK